MQYETRKMTAAKEFRHEGQNLKPGDVFDATVADAKYLDKHGRATYSKENFNVAPAAPSKASVANNAKTPAAPVYQRPVMTMNKPEDEKKVDSPVMTTEDMITRRPV